MSEDAGCVMSCQPPGDSCPLLIRPHVCLTGPLGIVEGKSHPLAPKPAHCLLKSTSLFFFSHGGLLSSLPPSVIDVAFLHLLLFIFLSASICESVGLSLGRHFGEARWTEDGMETKQKHKQS